MINEVTISDAARHFSEYVERVAKRGEHFIVVRGSKRVAELAPVAASLRLRDLPKVLKSLPRLSRNEANAFRRDLLRERRRLAMDKPQSPWDS